MIFLSFHSQTSVSSHLGKQATSKQDAFKDYSASSKDAKLPGFEGEITRRTNWTDVIVNLLIAS